MPYLFYLLILALSSLAAEEPWGKDAQLIAKPLTARPPSNCQTPIVGFLAEGLIRFHQEIISPADGPRSNFKPSSSQYTLDAMRAYGFFRGYLMGCDRLMRENDAPWVYKTVRVGPRLIMKYDPVPCYH